MYRQWSVAIPYTLVDASAWTYRHRAADLEELREPSLWSGSHCYVWYILLCVPLISEGASGSRWSWAICRSYMTNKEMLSLFCRLRIALSINYLISQMSADCQTSFTSVSQILHHLPGQQLNSSSVWRNQTAAFAVRKHELVGYSESRSEPCYRSLCFRLMVKASGLVSSTSKSQIVSLYAWPCTHNHSALDVSISSSLFGYVQATLAKFCYGNLTITTAMPKNCSIFNSI